MMAIHIDPSTESTLPCKIAGHPRETSLDFRFFIHESHFDVVPGWFFNSLLMLIVLFEAARSPDLVTGIRTFLGYLSYAAVFTAPFYLKECQKYMRFCIYLVLLSSLVPALYGFVDFAHGGGVCALAGQIQSTFPHPNIFAFYLVLVISLGFYLMKSPAMNASWVQRCVLCGDVAGPPGVDQDSECMGGWLRRFFGLWGGYSNEDI